MQSAWTTIGILQQDQTLMETWLWFLNSNSFHYYYVRGCIEKKSVQYTVLITFMEELGCGYFTQSVFIVFIALINSYSHYNA